LLHYTLELSGIDKYYKNPLSVEVLIERLPEYSQDIGKRFSQVMSNYSLLLSSEQFFCIIVSAAYAIGNDRLLNYIRGDAKLFLDKKYADICKKSSVIMNTLVGVMHFDSSNDELFDSLLRDLDLLNSFTSYQQSSEMFDICCFVVSLVLGNASCIAKYTDYLLKNNVISQEQLEFICKTVALLKGISNSLSIESMRTYEFGN